MPPAVWCSVSAGDIHGNDHGCSSPSRPLPLPLRTPEAWHWVAWRLEDREEQAAGTGHTQHQCLKRWGPKLSCQHRHFITSALVPLTWLWKFPSSAPTPITHAQEWPLGVMLKHWATCRLWPLVTPTSPTTLPTAGPRPRPRQLSTNQSSRRESRRCRLGSAPSQSVLARSALTELTAEQVPQCLYIMIHISSHKEGRRRRRRRSVVPFHRRAR